MSQPDFAEPVTTTKTKWQLYGSISTCERDKIQVKASSPRIPSSTSRCYATSGITKSNFIERYAKEKQEGLSKAIMSTAGNF